MKDNLAQQIKEIEGANQRKEADLIRRLGRALLHERGQLIEVRREWFALRREEAPVENPNAELSEPRG